ncbi:UbiA family prenyltransferase [Prosthecochloris sp. HL-130-GSB]|uniref:UbiA family prenyltransferase n=1 Tax=Prosthecochloris sp. HL-130-GSB TaxID=1974213 RepID=UPI000A1BFF95|nr:UbiA family prenyltransferase [Prosthecochloris sp. HL-130-GSB]ARM31793.1 bacteriochlorophyll c synthase [Prosthecochloris sp. HL-130-GSB]MBO8092392.1 UbiA family prenyltransferase [Prosthecochloris sp.]
MAISVSRSGFVDKLKAHLELLDPVTWISVFPCLAGGVMASGNMQPTLYDYGMLALLFIIYGPLGTGFSQSVNDYYDLELDRVNEPTRPIPSGRISEREAIWNWSIVLLTAVSLGVWISLSIGGQRGIVFASCLLVGLVLGYIYSAPPLKLKKNIFFSAPAVGLSYGFITYLSANALFSDIRPEVVGLAGLNFFMAVALIIMNDFKSAEGDARSGMKSLTVLIGARNTFLVAFVIIDLVFAVFAFLAWNWGFHYLMVLILVSLVVNIVIQVPIYTDPGTGASFMQTAVSDGFGNAIGKSDVQEHNAFLRFQVINNILFLLNQFTAAALIGIRYM